MNQQEAKKLENKVLDTLKPYLKQNNTVIAAVSGGPDSIFLLHFLQQLPAKIIVSHVDHMIRKNSHRDAQFVKGLSQNFHLKTVNIRKLASEKKQGLEETGRKIRYQFFNRLRKQYDARYIVTAHHADDNLETILLNFTRGASLEGLCGMSEIEGNLLRPLLGISKAEIIDYLKLRKIIFKKDKSNKDTTLSRNFIRHRIIPGLKKLNPNISNTLKENIENLKEINEHFKKTAQEWLKKRPGKKLDAKSFRKEPKALKKMILLEAYKKIVGNSTNISSVHLTEVLKIIENNIGNKEKKLGKITVKVKNNIIELK